MARLRQQLQGFGGVVVVAVSSSAIVAGHACGYEALRGGYAHAVLKVGNDLAAVYGVVDGAADERIGCRLVLHYRVGGISEEADVFGVQVSALLHVEFTVVFFFQRTVLGKYQVFGCAQYAVDKVHLALQE